MKMQHTSELRKYEENQEEYQKRIKELERDLRNSRLEVTKVREEAVRNHEINRNRNI
jgi:hypothetical protein